MSQLNGILDRVYSKLQDCSCQFLYPSVKEVLLKVVAYAMPDYIIQCFLPPIELCQDIEKVMQRFW